MSKSALLPIEKRVKRHLELCFPAAAPPVLVTGVSGGPDSMALLSVLSRLGSEVTVVHINYLKRGEESDMDQELTEQAAKKLDYDCRLFELDLGDPGGENFQQRAREERYRIFREVRQEIGADGIVVAHHRDDQIETILQKLFRGAGLESWSGMDIWNGEIFRPLLDTGREEILDYIEARSVPYRTDRSNLESDFARNLLRNEWLDKLEHFFPGWKRNVLRLSTQADLFGEALRYIEKTITDRRDRVDFDSFLNLSLSLQKALVLHMLKQRDPSVEVSTHALDRINELPGLQTGKTLQLNDQYSLLADRKWLKIVFEHPESHKSIELKREELKKGLFSYDGLKFTIKPADKNPDYEYSLYLDVEKIGWPLELRQWMKGDEIQPLGMEGHQKVSDHLTNRKISAAEKNKSMVLESFEETICAIIFPPIEKMNPPGTISELVKCDDQTSECLIIEWNNS